MGSPSVIDIESLTKPISEESPQGTDIREDSSPSSVFYKIKDARNGARAAERANEKEFDVEDTVDSLSMWKPVLEIAPDILTNTSKDLEVLCWYTEALIRFYGFAGLRDGLALTKEIVEKYWENLYPEPDEDGMETKVAPITGLNGEGGNGTLLNPIRNSAITSEGPKGEFTLIQYQQAKDNDKVSDDDKKQARIGSAGFSLQDMEETISRGSNEFYINLIDDLEECNGQFLALNDLLMANCGHDAPPTTSIRELLDEVLRSVRFLTKEKLAVVEEVAAEIQSDEGDSPAVASGTARSGVVGKSGPIAGREDALKRLQEIADYFRLHEPHTPLSPAIERIVAWGRMSVADLMMELVPDSNARGMLSQLTGIKLDGSDTHQYVAPPVAVVEQEDVSQTNSEASEAPAESGW
ncbi:MAG: type VI secretion system protein ImpA [Oceanicoccus sp.]|jgi:type VI secretion system protein ImpA